MKYKPVFRLYYFTFFFQSKLYAFVYINVCFCACVRSLIVGGGYEFSSR